MDIQFSCLSSSRVVTWVEGIIAVSINWTILLLLLLEKVVLVPRVCLGLIGNQTGSIHSNLSFKDWQIICIFAVPQKIIADLTCVKSVIYSVIVGVKLDIRYWAKTSCNVACWIANSVVCWGFTGAWTGSYWADTCNIVDSSHIYERLTANLTTNLHIHKYNLVHSRGWWNLS